MSTPQKRCAWADTHELFAPYHDEEWGVPTHDDRLLFELINLEGAQAGLSWLTILKKRAGYRKAFDNFKADKIAKYDAKKKATLVRDAGIVRHKQKIAAVVDNAKAVLAVRKEFGSFDKYLWNFIGGKTIVGRTHKSAAEAASVALSKDLKKRGFRFVGPTTCYAFMQAVGMIDDHSPECFRSKTKSKL